MKLFPSLLAAGVLAFAAGNAHASNADLLVTGSITPDACTMSLTNSGDVDLGILDISTMNAAAVNPLADQVVDVAIACSAPVKFATMATEDRPGTSYTAGNDYFGLNNAANGAPIGHYTIKAATGLADGTAATVISSLDVLAWSSPAGGVKVEHGTGAKYTAVGSAVSGPAAATNASWKLTISPTIAPIDTLALTGPQDIDGRMTLTVVYL